MERLSRREMLALIEMIAVSTTLPACKKRRVTHDDIEDEPPSEPPPDNEGTFPLGRWGFRALEAATARILPSAADFAGARDANVTGFINRQLQIPPFKKLAPVMVILTRQLDDQATKRGKKAFADLDVAQQDQVLEELSRGEWKDVPLPQRELFRVLHGLTLEGFLADPVHGGNRDGVGWKAIDFSEPPLRTPGAGGHDHGG